MIALAALILGAGVFITVLFSLFAYIAAIVAAIGFIAYILVEYFNHIQKKE